MWKCANLPLPNTFLGMTCPGSSTGLRCRYWRRENRVSWDQSQRSGAAGIAVTLGSARFTLQAVVWCTVNLGLRHPKTLWEGDAGLKGMTVIHALSLFNGFPSLGRSTLHQQVSASNCLGFAANIKHNDKLKSLLFYGTNASETNRTVCAHCRAFLFSAAVW